MISDPREVDFSGICHQAVITLIWRQIARLFLEFQRNCSNRNALLKATPRLHFSSTFKKDHMFAAFRTQKCKYSYLRDQNLAVKETASRLFRKDILPCAQHTDSRRSSRGYGDLGIRIKSTAAQPDISTSIALRSQY